MEKIYTVPYIKYSDIDKAMLIMQSEISKHPNFLDHRTEEDKKADVPKFTVRLIGFGDTSVILRAYAWSQDHSSGFVLKTDDYKTIKEEFDKNGIEIPFPYRTIVYKNK